MLKKKNGVRVWSAVRAVRRAAAVAAVVAAVALAAAGCDLFGTTRPTVYCVAPGGDDGAAGTVEAPWASFARAMEELTPGDTLFVRGGVYRQRLVATVSGEAGRPISFAAFPGETPVIDGTGLTVPNDWGGLIEAGGRAYLTFQGFTVRDSPAAAIFVCDGTGYRVLDNRTERSHSSGVQAWGDADLTVSGNVVVDACLGGEGHQEHISVAHSAGFTVAGNEVYGGLMEGIDVKDGCGRGEVSGNYVHDLVRVGVYVDAWDSDQSGIAVHGNRIRNCRVGVTVNSENGGICSEVRIYGNVLEDNAETGLWIGGGGVAEADHPVRGVEAWANVIRGTRSGDGVRVFMVLNGRVEDVYLHDNLVYANSRSGVMVADARPTDGNGAKYGAGSLAGVRIVNNTVAGNGLDQVKDGGWAGGGVSLFNALATGVVVRNNILSGNVLYGIATGSDYQYAAATVRTVLAIDHNLVDGYRANGAYHETYGDDAVLAAPGFANGPMADFRLAAGAAAIVAGVAAGAPPADFAGAARPASGSCAAGAYEYAAP
jgi:hypothetical protein